MILVSACLIGVNCKYNGNNNLNKKILDVINEKKIIPVCPEQLGGLSTPRLPCEVDFLNKNKVINNKGEDVTQNFLKGAKETLEIAKKFDVNKAILKSKSPSCGYGKIYDGTFKMKLINGNGITTDLLLKNGIKIYTEEDIEKLIKDE